MPDKACQDICQQLVTLIALLAKEQNSDQVKAAHVLLEQVVREVENRAVLRVKRQNEIKRLK